MSPNAYAILGRWTRFDRHEEHWNCKQTRRDTQHGNGADKTGLDGGRNHTEDNENLR